MMLHRIVVPQLLNALTMVAPLFCLWRHRRKKSWYRPIMCLHIPTSVAYHVMLAFPLLPVPHGFIWTFKALDFFFIHLMSLASRVDFGRKRHIMGSALCHSILLLQSTAGGRDPVLAKCILMVHDNLHLLNVAKHDTRNMALAAGVATLSLYATDTTWDYGHAVFHITLYWLFDTYFCIWQDQKGT